MILFLVSFIAGILTVLAPCVLPLLPVIIGGSVVGKPSVARALRITLSLGASVFIFTLILKVSTAFVNIPPQVWSTISATIIIVTGLVMVFPSLWERVMSAKFSARANRVMSKGAIKKTIWGDILVGAALGPVFSSCSPTYFILLAVVLPAHPFTGLLYLLSYVAGLCLFLFIIAFLGQRLLTRLDIAADPRGVFKRVIGVLFVLLGVFILFGIDKKIQSALPAGFEGITAIEQRLLKETTRETVVTTSEEVSDTADATSTPASSTLSSLPTVSKISTAQAVVKSSRYPKAKELVSPDAYLNTGGVPIKINDYKGKKVVLVDFWTYSCINCLRTVPYLKSWYAKYKDQGLEIIAIHTPEFAFEHSQKNVEDALTRLGITYPVVLDNEYKTWNNFGNQFWPHEYLIDIDGYVVHDHIGEGGYDETEKEIQKALKERADRLGMAESSIPSGTIAKPGEGPNLVGSPEVYFGASRNEYLANGKSGAVGVVSYVAPDVNSVTTNKLYLGGTWDMSSERATTKDSSEGIVFKYNARDVYFVASADVATQIEIYQDGKLLGSSVGEDVRIDSTATISGERLYKLVHNAGLETHTLEIKIKGKGLHAYTFTFG